MGFHGADKLLLFRVETAGEKRVCRIRDLLGPKPTEPLKEITDFTRGVFGVGGVAATISGSPTATILSVVVPGLPLGPIDVKVINPDGQQTVLAAAYFVLPAPPPVLGGVSLNAGPAPGAVIQLYGTGFQPGSQVFVGGVLATLSGTSTASTLTVVVPALPLGAADVKVVNPDGQESVLPGAFFAMPGAFFALAVS